MGAYAKFDHHRSILSVSYTSNFPNTTQTLLPYSENTAKLWSNPRRSCRKQSISFFQSCPEDEQNQTLLNQWRDSTVFITNNQAKNFCWHGPHKEKGHSKILMGVLQGILNCNWHSSAKPQFCVSLEVTQSQVLVSP